MNIPQTEDRNSRFGSAGGRSATGRQGPVVGKQPRRTRPLNPVEIVSNWDILRDACIARHGMDSPELQQELTTTVAAVMESVLENGFPDGMDGRLSAYPHVQQALAWSGPKICVAVLSHFPEHVTRQVLSACGYDISKMAIMEFDAVHSFDDLPFSDDATHQVPQEVETHVIMDSLRQLNIMKEKLLGMGGAAGVRERLHALWHDHPAAEQEAAHSPCSFKLCLCDWGVATPGMRARALSDGSMSCISDVQLADLLDVTHVDEVMDGIAWQ
jgi:hypothetical protein